MNKIIFLDIDGCIVTHRSHFAYKEFEGYPTAIGGGMMLDPDPVAGKFLWRLCNAYDIKIVISSTWRKHEGDLWPLLDKLELRQFLHEDWKTTTGHIHFGYVSRGEEIKEWLDRHPEVTDYRIIDDDIDMLPEQNPYFIQTDGYNGLLHKNMQDLLKWNNHQYGIGHLQLKEKAKAKYNENKIIL